jgi:hypothetical protein
VFRFVSLRSSTSFARKCSIFSRVMVLRIAHPILSRSSAHLGPQPMRYTCVSTLPAMTPAWRTMSAMLVP